jgi:diguanylate cyclase (GGDEF)-like protein
MQVSADSPPAGDSQNTAHKPGTSMTLLHSLGHTLSRIAATTRLLAPELVLLSLMLAAIWVGDVVILLNERSHRVEAARADIASIGRAYGESVARIVSEIDLTLVAARRAYEQLGPNFDISQWAYRDIHEDDLRVQISLIDRDGNVVRSTLERSNQKPINIADRPHFKAQLDPNRDELWISDPVVGRGSGQTTIQFTRKVLDHAGNFSGIVVLSMGRGEFEKFLRSASMYQNDIVVTNDRGFAIAAYPPGTGNETVFQLAASSAPQAEQRDTARIAATTGGLVSTTAVQHFPLSVVVYRPYSAIFASYGRTRMSILAVGLVASTMVVLLGTFWLRQRFGAISSARVLQATFAGVTHGIIMLDRRGAMLVANASAITLLAEVGGSASSDGQMFLKALQEKARSLPPASRRTEPAADWGVTWETSLGANRDLEVRTTMLDNGASVHGFADITEQKMAREQIQYHANHDPLTGLPNRYCLELQLVKKMAKAETRGARLAVAFLDLDGFKLVNDTYGHLCGDKLLKHISSLLQQNVGPDDIVARMGGDEFVIVRFDSHVRESVETLSRNLIEAIRAPVMIDGQEMRVGVSIGVAIYPKDGATQPELFRKADIALYRAKGEGRGTWRFYEPHMEEMLQRRASLEESLRLALSDKKLEVFYQPQVNSETLAIAGFEALARWHLPSMGWIAPSVFIPLAEECGLMRHLGALVLDRALTDAAAWPGECTVAVNVSASQLLEKGFVKQVQDALTRAGFPGNRLELEITETVMFDSGFQVVETLEELRQLGIKLSLDDFGTGCSSLSNLLRFYFDKIKIDSSFVQRQATEASARAILEATLILARNLHIEVVAEGVETAEQLADLKRQGCALVQGHLLAKPLPRQAVLEMLAQKQPSIAA